jgi:hypothetical protein
MIPPVNQAWWRRRVSKRVCAALVVLASPLVAILILGVTKRIPPLAFDVAQTLAAAQLSLVVYLAPAIIAALRKKKNIAAIAILNVLLGWTLAGWVAALVWSALRDEPRPVA